MAVAGPWLESGVLRLAVLAVSLALLSCGTRSSARRPAGAPPAAGAPGAPGEAPLVTPAPAPPPAQPSPEVLVARARTLRAEGDVAGAQARLEVALLVAPGHDDARIELADLLVADGRELSRAEALLAGVTAPLTPRLHLVGARLAEARGDDARAAAEYALALDGEDDPDARLRRALALERLGQLEEATAELERVRAARPGDLVTRARLAERYEAAGRLAEAEGELRSLAEEDAARAAGWERLARFYERIGRERDARAAAGRARTAAARPERELRPLLPSRR
jgi:predicted Zn-dependent protease